MCATIRRCSMTNRRRIRHAWLGLVAAAGVWHGVAAQQEGYSEAEVKAAFLYHFCTYVQWPNAPQAADPITIAVFGAEQVATQLAVFLPGRTVAGRRVLVRPLDRIQDLRDDEVLFIGSDRNGELRELVEGVGQRPVLIVTDDADGLARGAMVNFRIVDRRVRFEISLPKAESAGLVLSSRLLSAALRVQTSDVRLDGYRWFERDDGVPLARLPP